MFRYETTFLPVFFLFVSLKETIVWIDAAAVVKLIIQNKHNNILTTDMVCWIEYKKKKHNSLGEIMLILFTFMVDRATIMPKEMVVNITHAIFDFHCRSGMAV